MLNEIDKKKEKEEKKNKEEKEEHIGSGTDETI